MKEKIILKSSITSIIKINDLRKLRTIFQINIVTGEMHKSSLYPILQVKLY